MTAKQRAEMNCLHRRAALRGFAIAGGLLGMWRHSGLVHADELAEEAALEAEVLAAEAPAPEEAVEPVVAFTSAPEAPAAPLISELEVQMLALVNGARIARRIAPLAWDPAIAEAARAHADYMMRTGIISHSGPDGSTPQQRMRRLGVKFQYGSENIWTYWGKVRSEGPSTMHAAMMAEPHAPGLWNHIGNILYGGYKRIGIGIVAAPNGVQYLSEKFAD
ncbi:MAG TPA: CAP domain-containing protein [Chloroflexota bacterium]|nr:CAP domain-containing protein [Chloroflexota bacterium]